MSTAKIQPRLETKARMLREAMQTAGLHPNDLAERMGVTRTTIYNWTTAKAAIQAPQAAKLSALLNLDNPRLLRSDVFRRGRPRRVPNGSCPVLAPVPVPEILARQPGDVFEVEARAEDGRLRIMLTANLPSERGMRLLKALLDLKEIQ